jgi:hypothetical protein
VSPTAPSRRRSGLRTFLTVIIAVLGLPLSGSMLLGMFGAEKDDPFTSALSTQGYGDLAFWIALGVGFVIFLIDLWLDAYNGRYADDLYAILKDVSESVKAGTSVEGAVQKAVGWKRSPAARAMQRALALSKDMPFATALRSAAASSGQPAFHEVALLMSAAVEGGGHIGPALRWLAAHLGKLRQAEKEFAASIESSVMLLRGVGLLAGPFLYQLMYHSVHHDTPTLALDIPSLVFFAYGTVAMAMLDGVVYGRWGRVPSKILFYLGLTRLSLGIWSI